MNDSLLHFAAKSNKDRNWTDRIKRVKDSFDINEKINYQCDFLNQKSFVQCLFENKKIKELTFLIDQMIKLNE